MTAAEVLPSVGNFIKLLPNCHMRPQNPLPCFLSIKKCGQCCNAAHTHSNPFLSIFSIIFRYQPYFFLSSFTNFNFLLVFFSDPIVAALWSVYPLVFLLYFFVFFLTIPILLTMLSISCPVAALRPACQAVLRKWSIFVGIRIRPS